MSKGIYIASRSKHAERWRLLRSQGVPISCTWIDEAGDGETSDWGDLWQRCIAEAASASAFLLYSGDGEVQKGALVELGAALHARVPVFAVVGEPYGIPRRALMLLRVAGEGPPPDWGPATGANAETRRELWLAERRQHATEALKNLADSIRCTTDPAVLELEGNPTSLWSIEISGILRPLSMVPVGYPTQLPAVTDVPLASFLRHPLVTLCATVEEALEKIRGPKEPRAFFFGCWGSTMPGHYIYTTDTPTHLHSSDDGPKLGLPWSKLDGPLCPGWSPERRSHRGASPYPPTEAQVEGQALLHHRGGWTALAFWDRSADERPGSNSAFLLEGTHDFDAMVAAFQRFFPRIVQRFSFPIVRFPGATP